MTLDEIKNALCKGEHSHMILSWNDSSGPNYQTVEDTILQMPEYYRDDSFVGGADGRQKCVDANSIWTAQWYPQTPVGFCVLHAATYEELHAALEAEAKGD